MTTAFHHRRLTFWGAGVAALALTGGAIAVAEGASATGTSSGKVLWKPDTAVGPSSFASVQCATGNFKVVSGGVKGKVWQAYQAAGQERCEALGPTLTEGQTFYVGWSSKVAIADSNDRYIFQLKCDPSTGTANHPIEIDATNGRVRLQEWDTHHVAHPIWTAPIANNQWHSYALKIHLARSGGTIDLWYDGAKQTFTTGSGTFTGTTYDGTSDYLKWGSYHPSSGAASNTFTSPTMATTLQSATSGS
jgi:hypothetical protein